MLTKKDALDFHKKHRGKIKIESVPVRGRHDLSLAYTPGVADVCLEIKRFPEKVYDYTSKWNSVAVVTDGSAILGLGDIGPLAGIPLAEGKCVLFKRFANIDAFPICLKTKDPEEIIDIIEKISPVFGGINLEDISSPRCFYIEDELKRRVGIPVFHDDQHGTAAVVLAGLINSLKVVKKDIEEIKVVVCGAGAAGTAVAKFLLSAGVKDIIMCDSNGIIYKGREKFEHYKEELAKLTNKGKIKGDLSVAMEGRDVFIGLSVGGIVSKKMIRGMAEKPVVFAMANPVPEIMPKEAEKGGAAIVATGRSDLPNQVNNLLGFPGIFRGALDIRASDINEEMKLAASNAIAKLVKKPSPKKIIPSPFSRGVVPAVAKAVAKAGTNSGVAKR